MTERRMVDVRKDIKQGRRVAGARVKVGVACGIKPIVDLGII